MQNTQFGSKNTIAYNMQKCQSFSMQKTARKNTSYWKNESILKIAKNGHNAKAIAHKKYSVSIKNKIA